MSAVKDRGVIPYETLTEGIDLCQRNVDRYLSDAYILESIGSFGHALALAVLALEECARKTILIAGIVAPQEASEKVESALAGQYLALEWAAAKLAGMLREAGERADLETLAAKQAEVLHRDKHLHFYVGYQLETGWCDPNRPDVEGGARHQLRHVEYLIKSAEPLVSKVYQTCRNRRPRLKPL